MNTSSSIGRRDFLRRSSLAGAGLILGAYLRSSGEAWAVEIRNQATPTLEGAKLNAFVRIASDGRVFIAAHAPEAGQGVRTSLPMIVAEELDVDWASVTVEPVPLDPEYRFQMAGGSRSIPSNFVPLRQAGATARAMLVAAAAQTWAVSAADCVTEAGNVVHRASGRRASYADLVALAATLPVPAADAVQLKAPSEFKIIGQRVSGVDNVAIVTGRPLFGIDQAPPGVLFAVFVKCPVFGGKVASVDLAAVKQLPGVVDAFTLEGTTNLQGLMPGVAIVARSTWQAFQARKALSVTWNEGPRASDSWTAFVAQAQSLAGKPGERSLRNEGDVEAALAGAPQKIEATYVYPFIGHTNLEPQNCTAHFQNGEMTIWAPTQNPGAGHRLVAETLSLDPAKIKVHITRIGGGFGRRLENDFMVECAAIAQQVSAPVKLVWTREDDMQHDQYRPGGVHHLRGATDASGTLVAWHGHCIVPGNQPGRPGNGAGMSGGEFPAPYVTNHRQELSVQLSGVPMSWWRAPGSNAHAWVIMSFLDELAHAAGVDPYRFGLGLLDKPVATPTGRGAMTPSRLRGVLIDVVQRSGWERPALPRGRGRGLGYYYSYGGYVAVVAEVTVSQAGELTVDRIVVSADVGSPIVNYSGAEQQLVGSMIDGLSAAWVQADDLREGRIVQSNFHDHPILRMPAVPKVFEVRFLETNNPPTGLGEPALPPVAPAVCNAIFAATGIRVRTLPISQHDLSWS